MMQCLHEKTQDNVDLTEKNMNSPIAGNPSNNYFKNNKRL